MDLINLSNSSLFSKDLSINCSESKLASKLELIQRILTLQFKINPKDTSEIEPEFVPIQVVFQ